MSASDRFALLSLRKIGGACTTAERRDALSDNDVALLGCIAAQVRGWALIYSGTWLGSRPIKLRWLWLHDSVEYNIISLQNRPRDGLRPLCQGIKPYARSMGSRGGSKSFRFNAKYALLTYAQCGDLDPWRINDHLGTLGAECCIGRENHRDGGIHYHAFVAWERKYSTRNIRAFDVDGCHPNISPSKGSPGAGFDYATKEGDIVAGGLGRPGGDRDTIPESGSKWHEIILAKTRDEFFGLCADLDPRSLCLNFPSLRTYADWRYRLEPAPYSHPTAIELYTDEVPALDRWAHDNLNNCNGGKLSWRGQSPLTGGAVLRTTRRMNLTSPCGCLGVMTDAWGRQVMRPEVIMTETCAD